MFLGSIVSAMIFPFRVSHVTTLQSRSMNSLFKILKGSRSSNLDELDPKDFAQSLKNNGT